MGGKLAEAETGEFSQPLTRIFNAVKGARAARSDIKPLRRSQAVHFADRRKG
jgi:hypothetical protein